MPSDDQGSTKTGVKLRCRAGTVLVLHVLPSAWLAPGSFTIPRAGRRADVVHREKGRWEQRGTCVHLAFYGCMTAIALGLSGSRWEQGSIFTLAMISLKIVTTVVASIISLEGAFEGLLVALLGRKQIAL